ncbi:E3 SUMO-protein ligase PIAS2-like [Daktulosphaira vitifoliae]|uniref:E3 SUMO-protein ligase PIAS2-like n=1 Tax=Daktulosphaira vitifoliae TaxID=58002 RepID=UPI0021AA737E|nr:E3 SUMO-protein ligase PIAS2-like [Daktulosphaira vitifoliae]XP_050544755.1 E3 SUMO-protein ligase PIAS2-like [Daktulosphaira vitifoliae]XP_050544756.1 E3 SUMO-protein ligase PIAS2-like [Daktulosphaira vitifoliae]XP_050544757.1 E3 SUMO-protein ligase PIAS2-like [Daktulosphaira vitifoliae]
MSGYTEETYTNLLNSFRTNDLQVLLGTFGFSTTGRKADLRDRAAELLRNKPTNFNFNAFLSKIVDIHHTSFRENRLPTSNNNLMRSMLQNQSHNMIPIGMQHHQQMFQPNQYLQQQMNMSRYRLPQVTPQMPKSIPENGHLQYNYPSLAPRSMVPRISSNPQNMVQPNQILPNMGRPTLNRNSVNPVTILPNNLKLKKLPFYEVIDEVIKPSCLDGQEQCSVPNAPKGMREMFFKINLSPEWATHISMNRDISNGKSEYTFQIQIRICQLEPDTEISDFMPLGVHIRVCGKVCQLPPSAPNIKPGVEARRIPRPINCTQHLKLNPNISNPVIVNWMPDGKTYVFCAYLVKKLNAESLLKKLQEKGARSAVETKNNIIKKLADVDPDLATTSYRFSLVCPLGKMRMKIPAKSTNCDHLQCFDASIFLLMNEKKPTWTCPTCSKPCIYDDIRIESYFLDVVSSPNLPENCKEIEIIADGSWKVYEEEKKLNNSDYVSNSKEKPIDSVDLDDDSDDCNAGNSNESNNVPNPEFSIEPENLKSSFVDLTISDDEESVPKDRDKQENEAVPVEHVQPVSNKALEPHAQQIQPQQAVTSSMQGVIIELDNSLSPPS